jgi:hypothetical protein
MYFGPYIVGGNDHPCFFLFIHVLYSLGFIHVMFHMSFVCTFKPLATLPLFRPSGAFLVSNLLTNHPHASIYLPTNHQVPFKFILNIFIHLHKELVKYLFSVYRGCITVISIFASIEHEKLGVRCLFSFSQKS